MNQSSSVTFFTIPMRDMSLRVTKMVERTSKAMVMARTTGPRSWTPSSARLDDMGAGSSALDRKQADEQHGNRPLHCSASASTILLLAEMGRVKG